jgi:glycosyltransferase involved in cell wall biosynthesis
MAHDPPMHPSYEDRPGAPDRVFASLSDEEYERQVRAWARALARAGAESFDVLHLHHLTPIHEAAAREAPGVPVAAHLHGTELLMLEAIAAGRDWPHAREWAERMRAWADRAALVILLSESQRERARTLLGVEPERTLVLPNGFDPELFHPNEDEIDRAAHWRRHLVEHPQGWRPDEPAGSVGYTEEDLEAFGDRPVLLYVGRFTEVKRVGLLIRAYARARRERGVAGPLVIVGGHPGEWEGEHPCEAIAAAGARGVFLAGWHEHDALPAFFAASDVVVLPSVREQFGQVLVEGMACGLPAIAVDRYGPAEIIEDGATGWLVEPDDENALTEAVAEALGDPAERARRGAAAARSAADRYAWPSIAGHLADRFDRLVDA